MLSLVGSTRELVMLEAALTDRQKLVYKHPSSLAFRWDNFEVYTYRFLQRLHPNLLSRLMWVMGTLDKATLCSTRPEAHQVEHVVGAPSIQVGEAWNLPSQV